MILPKSIMGIDPGSVKTAYCTIGLDYKPVASDIIDNTSLYWRVAGIIKSDPSAPRRVPTVIAMEYIISRKWAGREVSDACIWSGMFAGSHQARGSRSQTVWVTRSRQIHHLTHKKSGGDKDVRTALIKRFDPDAWERHQSGEITRIAMLTAAKNYWFNTDGHAFHDDIWQAYGIAVTAMDIIKEGNDEILRNFVE